MMNDGWVYIGAIDVARGGTGAMARTHSGHGDDFSIFTVRWRPGSPAQGVHIFRQTGIELPQMSYQIHKQHQAFHYSLLVADPGGGGGFLQDELRRPIQSDGTKSMAVTPIITEDDALMLGVGETILCYFNRGDSKLKRVGLSFPSESHLINLAHDKMRAAFQHQTLLFPPEWDGWKLSGKVFSHADQKRAWLNMQEGLSDEDRVRAELDLALDQMLEIERENGPDGKPLLDKYQNFSFGSKRKKDAAYTVIYGNFGVWLYQRLTESLGPALQKRQIVVEAEDIN